MQRKKSPISYPNSIKMPDNIVNIDTPQMSNEEDSGRQMLINFGHGQWGFNNWSWSVTKQDLDFVDLSNGRYCAGVAAFVSVVVKSLDIRRDNVGYATIIATNKGLAIHRSRKCAVTNALRETLLSFGGKVTTELLELLEASKTENPHSETTSEHPSVKSPPAVKSEHPSVKLEPPVKSEYQPPVVKRNDQRHSAVKNAGHTTKVQQQPIANLPPLANRAPPVGNAARPPPPAMAPPPPAPRPPSNEITSVAPAGVGGVTSSAGGAGGTFAGMTEEEAREERKRRQRAKQEEFRRQMIKKDETPELSKTSSFDCLLRDLPSQDIVIEETGSPTTAGASDAAGCGGGLEGKRRSPVADHDVSKRRAGLNNRLDIVMDKT